MKEETLFAEALAMKGEARAAFLNEHCKSDVELHRRLEALLHASDNPDPFLNAPEPVGSATIDQAQNERISTVIGPYKLLEQIGEGGMGTVYMAEQTMPIQRKVALKVIKAGMDTAQVVARFEAERQALAMMDHVNIARVLDTGATETGRPYFVMELVHGIPINKYCDDNRLTPRERLELFVPVCNAIQHAHQKGIIHRDIKPSNVMVTLYDGKPVPKVIDFGVAKATEHKLTDRTLFTHYGAQVGTLEYMSPEQADMSALGVDTRSDIYSLGVLLYELLTGSTPLTRKRMKEAAHAEILRLIKEEEPPRPSNRLSDSGEALASISANRHMEPAKLAKLLRGELDWIVMKCLEKDRNRRYETTNSFAMDVQRYLADEPVLACPPSTGYRIRKLTRRHRRSLTAALAFVLLLVAAVVTLTIALVAVDRERTEKEAALEAAGKRRTQTRKALDAMSSDVIDDWLFKQPSLLPEHKRFLERVLRDYEEFAADTGQDEESRAGVASAYGRVAYIRSMLGQRHEAEAAWHRCRELFAGLVADFPRNPAHRKDVASVHMRLIHHYRVTGQPQAAMATCVECLTMWRDLSAMYPEVPGHQSSLAMTLNQRGILLKNLGQTQEAEVVYREALAILKPLVANFPEEPDHLDGLGGTFQNLGVLLDKPGRSREVVLKNPGRSQEAAEAFGQAVMIFKQLVDRFPLAPAYRNSLAMNRDHQASSLRDAGRFPAAEEIFRQALTTRRQLVAEFPGRPDYREGLAVTLNNLAILLKNDNRAPDAVELYGESLAIHKKLADEFPDIPDYQNRVAGAMVNLARLRLADKDFNSARRLLEDGVPYHQAALKASPDHPAYCNFYRLNRWRMAETLLELKDHVGAAEAAGQFLKMNVEPPRDAYTAACLLAGCVRLAAQDERLTANKRRALATTYGDSAVAALRQAIAMKAKEVTQMAKDPSLDPLQSRVDFKKLLDEQAAKEN